MIFRRPIPCVARVSLVLGACGEMGGGADPSDIAATYPDFCDRLLRCNPDAFDAEYASLDDCVVSQANYFADFEYNFGTECLEAYARRASCFFETTGGACDTDPEDAGRACAEAQADIDALCALAY